MLKPLSGLLNLALPAALREPDTGPEAAGMPFADVFAALGHDTGDSAEAEEGEGPSELSVDEPEVKPSDEQEQAPDTVAVDPDVSDMIPPQRGAESGAAPVPRHDLGRGDGDPPFQADRREAPPAMPREVVSERPPQSTDHRTRAQAFTETVSRSSEAHEPGLSKRPTSKPLAEGPVSPVHAHFVPRAGVSPSRADEEDASAQIGAVQPSGSRREPPGRLPVHDMSLRQADRRVTPRIENASRIKPEAANEIEIARSDTRQGPVKSTGAVPLSAETLRPQRGARFRPDPQANPDPKGMPGTDAAQALSTSTTPDARQPSRRPGALEPRYEPSQVPSVQSLRPSKAETSGFTEDLRVRASGGPPIPQPAIGPAQSVPQTVFLPSNAGAERRVTAGEKPPSGELHSVRAPVQKAPEHRAESLPDNFNRQEFPKQNDVRPVEDQRVSRPRTIQRSELTVRTETPVSQRLLAQGDAVIPGHHMPARKGDADGAMTPDKMRAPLSSEAPPDKALVRAPAEGSSMLVPRRGTSPTEVPVKLSDRGRSDRSFEPSAAREPAAVPTRPGLVGRSARMIDGAVAHDPHPIQSGQSADRPSARSTSETASVVKAQDGDWPGHLRQTKHPAASADAIPSRETGSKIGAHPAEQVAKDRMNATVEVADAAVRPPRQRVRDPKRKAAASPANAQHGVVPERLGAPSALQQPERAGRADTTPVQSGRPTASVPDIRAVPVSDRSETVPQPAILDSPPKEPRDIVSLTETQNRRRDQGHDPAFGAAAPPVAKAGAPVVASRPPLATGTNVARPRVSVISPVIDLEEPLSEDLFAAPVPNGSSAGPASAPGHAAGIVSREAAASVLRQATEAMTTAVDPQDKVIELKLRPEELGQLRFRIGQGESGLMLSVTADRPETLDLLRRNIDQLARHLSDLGYGSASFSFGEERPGSQSRAPREAGAHGSDQVGRPVTEAAVPDPVAPAPDGLDLRL